jgi:hypothetical protein
VYPAIVCKDSGFDNHWRRDPIPWNPRDDVATPRRRPAFPGLLFSSRP